MSYTFSQGYDSIHIITQRTQQALASSSLQPQISYNYPYTYPEPAPAPRTMMGRDLMRSDRFDGPTTDGGGSGLNWISTERN
jgi:hypothetical protein